MNTDNLNWHNLKPNQQNEIIRDSEELTSQYGLPIIRELQTRDISSIKTHLAAGWVVVVSTTLTDAFLGPGFEYFGLPVVPLPGQERLKSGHAWLLVGYDHVDGNDKWMYQGHFIALNSWGRSTHTEHICGAGLCSIPFAMLLTEGIEVFALRLR